MERPMPYTACFDAVYNPGKVVAVSYAGGKEISRAELETAGEPAKVRLVPEKNECRPDGHDLIYVGIEVTDSEGRLVPDAEISVTAEVIGPATLAGFGSANPITDEDYTDVKTTTFRGHAMAVIRAGYESGEATLRVSSAALAPGDEACVSFRVQ
jgi:beta-galactosidase